MAKSRSKRTAEQVVSATSLDLHKRLSAALTKFNREGIDPTVLVLIAAYNVMQVQAGVYSYSREEWQRERTLKLGRELALRLCEVLTSDRPDEAWERVTDLDARLDFVDPGKH